MQKFEEAYGKPEDNRAEAATLGMPVEAYYDYITTQDPKGIAYKFRKQDPYYAPEFDIAPDPKEQEELDPLRIYFNRELQRQNRLIRTPPIGRARHQERLSPRGSKRIQF